MPFNLAKTSGANFIHQLTAWPKEGRIHHTTKTSSAQNICSF